MMQFEVLYHYGYGNILGDIPFRHLRLFTLAKEVYDLCRQPNLIQDLSLPNVELYPTLDEVLSLISIKFVLEPDREVRGSCTFPPSAHTREIKVHIFYSRMEMSCCPQCIESLVSHELSHAIRAGIVSLANLRLANQGLAPPYYIITPAKAPNDRITSNTNHLYKLEFAEFHAGYLIEHLLYGGIIARLTGSYFFPPGVDETPTIHRVNCVDAMFVKIVSRDPKVWEYLDGNGDLVHFDRLECFVFDGSSFSSRPEIMFHFGTRMTRSK